MASVGPGRTRKSQEVPWRPQAPMAARSCPVEDTRLLTDTDVAAQGLLGSAELAGTGTLRSCWWSRSASACRATGRLRMQCSESASRSMAATEAKGPWAGLGVYSDMVSEATRTRRMGVSGGMHSRGTVVERETPGDGHSHGKPEAAGCSVPVSTACVAVAVVAAAAAESGAAVEHMAWARPQARYRGSG